MFHAVLWFEAWAVEGTGAGRLSSPSCPLSVPSLLGLLSPSAQTVSICRQLFQQPHRRRMVSILRDETCVNYGAVAPVARLAGTSSPSAAPAPSLSGAIPAPVCARSAATPRRAAPRWPRFVWADRPAAATRHPGRPVTPVDPSPLLRRRGQSRGVWRHQRRRHRSGAPP